MPSGSKRGLAAWLGEASGTVGWVLALTIVFAGGVTGVRLREPALLKTVKIAVGSEDMAFFDDPAVQAEFQANGLNVAATAMGSGQMISSAQSGLYDAVLPSSDAYYRLIKAALPTGHYLNPYQVFHTRLAVFTRKKYLPILREAGFIDQQGDFDVEAYLTKIRTADITWGQFQGSPTGAPPAMTRILLRMTDPADSDSGAVFTAYAAYLFNGGAPVNSDQQVKAVTQKISSEFTDEGNAPTSTQYAFDEFANGISPLELGYASEAADQSPQAGQGFPSDGTSLPLSGGNVDCAHTLLALNANEPADKLGSLLGNDQVLQDRERAHGFNHTGSPTDSAIPASQWLAKLIAAVASGD